MKILMINTFHFYGGGDRTYLFSLSKLLQKKGHSVEYFAMKNSKNLPYAYESFFVSEVNFAEAFRKRRISDFFKISGRVIYSIEAKKKLNKLIDKINPDIAHIHTIHRHISPSIIHTLKSKKIPIVWTLHNYELLCPKSNFYLNNKICEQCKEKKFYNATINKCVKNSYIPSLLSTISSYIHYILKIYKDIDYFFCPSNFLMQKYLEYGFPKEKLILLRNFIDIKNIEPNFKHNNYGLYTGRLSSEKGLFTLLNAIELNKKLKFKIAGEGQLKSVLKKIKNERKINNVELLGFMSGNELKKLYREAKFVVLPSEWYENGPMSIIEAFSHGKPVIGSNIGGIPEMVKEGKNGFLFKPGDYVELSKKITLLEQSDYLQLARNARKFAERFCNEEEHYKALLNYYLKITR